MRKKALLAIAFAGGLLNQPLPALSENESNPSSLVSETGTKSTALGPEHASKPIDFGSKEQSKPDQSMSLNASESSDSLIEQIAGNAQLRPEIRAFYLLSIANQYLNGEARSTVDPKFKSVPSETGPSCFLIRRPEFWESSLISLADRVSEDHSIIHVINQKKIAKSNLNCSPDETSVLADKAIQKALATLNEPSPFGNFAKLNLYFVASRLFQKMGNIAGSQKCDHFLESAFRSADKDSPIDEPQTRAAVSILNSIANGIIAVHISDSVPNSILGMRQTQVKPFTEKDFLASQKLKLRALAMVDRLPESSHVRRKAHRDLALWYVQLSKVQLAETQKQVLFELVGFTDDSILYPKAQGCGRVVWWERQDSGRSAFGCGMG